jgi:hypothetical protein
MIIIESGGKVNMTIANTFVSLVSAPATFVFWFDFAETLLFTSWKWVLSELDGRARLPVFTFSANGSPFAHLIEGLNLCLIIRSS